MKTKNKFSTIKVGYSAGIYGCSNEYFTTIIFRDGEVFSLSHKGLYGSEERINALLRDAGYENKYVPSTFGKMKSSDFSEGGWRGFQSEYSAMEYVKYIIENGKYPQ